MKNWLKTHYSYYFPLSFWVLEYLWHTCLCMKKGNPLKDSFFSASSLVDSKTISNSLPVDSPQAWMNGTIQVKEKIIK